MVTLADILQVELEGLNTHLIKIAQVLDKRLDDIDRKLNRLANK